MIVLAIAIVSAAAGQVLVSHHDLRGLGLYALAIAMLVLTLRRDEQVYKLVGKSASADRPPSDESASANQSRYQWLWRLMLLPLALTSATMAYLWASENTFRWYGVVAWLLAVGSFLLIFWKRDPQRPRQRWLGFGRDGWHLRWTTLAVAGLILIGCWFRFWQLNETPPEMTSDHIEKLLDMHDLVTGQRPIFFVRNTGREPWQFYWTLMFIHLLDLDTKFFALKLGTAVIGVLTLPGIYLLGRDLFGRRVGLWATLFTAVASWPVILSRIGLRFPFAPAATAWSLLYLLRGLRDGRRNDFLLLGLWLGIGLQGYTAFRAMPLAVVICWGLTLILRPSSLVPRRSLVRNALLTVLIALVVFIPLGRFSMEHPEDFWGRSFSRVADPNQSMPDGPVLTFVKNLGDLALMFHWEGDDVWVNALMNAPVLDPLLGGLLVLGLVVVLWRGLRRRDPIAPLLVVAGVILLLPSALSLAYPIENPSVVRTGGAIPAVMVIAALPLGLTLERNSLAPRTASPASEATLPGWRRGLVASGALILVIAVTVINYQRYFSDYWRQYQRYALNTTEIASALQGFIESGGSPDNAWIVAWPYWIDTRGAGIELGDPTWNNVILDPEELDTHADQPRPRFYVLYWQDYKTLEHLQTLFPRGWSHLYASESHHGDFVLYYVPPEKSGPLAPLLARPGFEIAREPANDLKGRSDHAP
jgi:hypothetical protein